MDFSANLALPFILPNQSQKHVTVNEAFRRLDAIVQLSVHSATVSNEPASPMEGDRYLIPAVATGMNWALFSEGSLAAFQDGTWVEFPPQPGWQALVEDTGEYLCWLDGVWSRQSRLGINTAPDATNRLSVKTNAALFSHEDGASAPGDIRLKLNKAAAGDTATCLFQTGGAGRAEIGLAGNDDFHLKVSPDGTGWAAAISADSVTGHVGIGVDVATERLEVGGAVRSHSAAGAAHFANANINTVLAPGAFVDIPDFSGLLLVVDTLTGALGQYLCGGGLTTLVANLVAAPGTLSFSTAPNRYVFTNSTGTTGHFRFLLFRVRDAA